MLPSRLFFDDSFFKGEETVKCDVFEKDGKIFVEMEAPGYTKDDISLSIDKGELSVTFEKENEKEEKQKKIKRGRFDRPDCDSGFGHRVPCLCKQLLSCAGSAGGAGEHR